jgi:hypothetical protein
MKKNRKKFWSISADIQPGLAAAANQAVVSLEIPAGYIYEVWNFIAAYYSSAHLAGRLNIVQSTTAAIGGTDILKAVVNFDPYRAVALGVAESKHLKGEIEPLCVVDNRDGVASVYLNVEIPQFVAIALVANAITQEYAVTVNGLYGT